MCLTPVLRETQVSAVGDAMRGDLIEGAPSGHHPAEVPPGGGQVSVRRGSLRDLRYLDLELANLVWSEQHVCETVVACRGRDTRVDIREARRRCPWEDRETRPGQTTRSHRNSARNNEVVSYRANRPGIDVEAFVAGETAEGAFVHVLRKLAIRGIT